MISIIVATMDNGKWLKKGFLGTFLDHQPDVDWELIVVSNGCDDLSYIEEVADQYAHFSHNVGYAAGATAGTYLAKYPYLSFMNDDIEITEDIYTPMLETMWFEDNVGMCSVSMYDVRYSETTKWCFAKLVPNFKSITVFDNMDEGKNLPDVYDLQKGQYAPNLLIPKHVFEEVGGFDLQFTPFNYEDVDMNFKVRKAGYRTVVLQNYSMRHMGAGTIFDYFGSDMIKWHDRNRERFKKKYGAPDAY